MPFKSEAQRRFMYARHPEIARRWTAESKGSNLNALAMASKPEGSKPAKKSRKKRFMDTMAAKAAASKSSVKSAAAKRY